MKKLLICIMVIVCLVGSASVTYGNSGSAIIPCVTRAREANRYFITGIFYSNITNDPATITITLYDTNGEIIKDTDNSQTAGAIQLGRTGATHLNYTENLSNASVSFTLEGHKTGWIAVHQTSNSTGTQDVGYGIIEWTQEGSAHNVQCLVAHGMMADIYTNLANSSRFAIPINNGMPF